MPKSSKLETLAKRARIVDVASGLFRARGYADVGISDVMKAAGMTQGGFYKHFPSKEALAAEAWSRGFESSAQAWNEVVGKASNRKRERALIDYYLAPKAPERACPMISFEHDASTMSENTTSRQAYRDGVKGLHDTFMNLATDIASSEEDKNKARMHFAAMVGANLLATAIGDEPWIAAIRNSLLADVVEE